MEKRSPYQFAGTERYKVKRRLGAGGMGVVYEAFDLERQQSVALKTLHAFDATALLRFKNEFRVLHDVEHDNLIRLYELHEEKGTCFFTMELVRGVDFLSYVQDSDNVSLDQERDGLCGSGAAERILAQTSGRAQPGLEYAPTALDLRELAAGSSAGELPQGSAPHCDEHRLRQGLTQLSRGLAALHEAGHVHRDVKPSNILVTDDGRVVLLDFGVATRVERSGDSSGGASRDSISRDVVGTVAYMSPEQAMSGDVGPAADCYSLGVVLFQALTGRLPHHGRNLVETVMLRRDQPPPAVRGYQPAVARDLDELCSRLLDREPSSRPSMADLAQLLGAEDAPDTAREAGSERGQLAKTPPFLGRDAELSELRALWRASRRRPVVQIIEAASGLGKSELLRHFCEARAAEDPELVVLLGRCYERESVSYKAIDGIADGLSHFLSQLSDLELAPLIPQDAWLLPRLFPVLGRIDAFAHAPRGDDYPDLQEQRRRMFAAFRELLSRLAEARSVILCIDDLQWTDTDSLLLLQEVLGDVRAPRILVLIASRPMPAAKKEPIFALLKDLDLRSLRLAPLSPEQSRQLAGLLVQGASPAVVDTIAREALGHPLFVQEMCRYVAIRGEPSGLALERVLMNRVQLLANGHRLILETICVAGARVVQEVAAKASVVSYGEFAEAVTTLQHGHFVRTSGVGASQTIEPYHDRVRECVTDGLAPERRHECHGRLVLALEERGAATAELPALVRHAIASKDLGRVARYAEQAAAAACEAMAFAQGAYFYRTALRYGQHEGDEERALVLRLAETYANAGRGPKAAEAFLRAAEQASPEQALACRQRAAEQWLVTGQLEQGLATLGELLADIGHRLPATPKRALASLLWQRARLRLRGMRWKQRKSVSIAPAELISLDVLKTAAQGLGNIDLIRSADFNVRFLRSALAIGEPRRVGMGIGLEAMFLASSGGGRGGRVRRQLGTIDALGEAGGDDFLRAWAVASRGVVHYLSGEFPRAEACLAKAVPLFVQCPGATFELNNSRVIRLFNLRLLGEFATSAALAGEFVRDAQRRGDRYQETTVRRFSGRYKYLADDNVAGARQDVDQTEWSVASEGFHMQHWGELEARGEIAVYAGAGQAAAALDELAPLFAGLEGSLLLRVEIIRVTAYYLRGRLLARSAALDTGAAPAMRREIAELIGKLGREKVGFAALYAQLLQAALCAQLGDRVGQERWLRSAVQVASDLCMSFQKAAAQRHLGVLVGGDEGATLLAESESWSARQEINNPARMADLAAPGLGARD